MKKPIIVAVCALVVFGLLMSSMALAEKTKDTDGTYKGNGFPSPSGRSHYSLNIIAVEHNDGNHFVGPSSGHTMFVRWSGNTKIIMQPGTEFLVNDRNGLDGRAVFTIPYTPELKAYDVYARAVGTPGGKVKIESWYNITGEPYVMLGTVELERGRGQVKAQNINKLFYIERYWIFDYPDFENYLWEYNNSYDGFSAVKVCQVRFYENTSYATPTPT